MLKRMAPAILGATLVSCTGMVGDPDATTTTFNLYIEPAGGLLARECVDRYGESGCTPYPNALECETMKLTVKADGRILMECARGGQLVRSGYAESPAVPFMCRADDALSCLVCVDVYGNTVHDTCNRNAQAFRTIGSGWGSAPPGTALLEEGGEPPPSAPPAPSASADPCSAENAVLLYASELNRVLGNQGLNFSWAPNLSQFPDASSGFFSGKNAKCSSYLASISSTLHKCVSGSGASCSYCTGSGATKTCRCYRINVAALEAACHQIPKTCDKSAWSASLIMAYGIATKWLFSPTYPDFQGKILPAASKQAPTSASQTLVTDNAAPQFPQCLGSPIVLDLGGDGVHPTAPADGVRFDLLGVGSQRTAWIAGDDALLALDRDGNGRIDSGAELFGEATAGRPHEDGFAALADLDSNRDGRIDRRDRSFARLLLWTDSDGDGVSRPGELATLARRGITSLDLTPTRHDARDRHGNDLGLCAGFTRRDGSRGLMVDVFFAAPAPTDRAGH